MNSAVGFLAGALLTTAAGQVLFKLSTIRQRNGLLVIGLGLLALATLCSLLALRTLGLGMVYLSTGLTHVLVLGASKWILGEAISTTRWVGAGLVVLGVACYAAGTG